MLFHASAHRHKPGIALLQRPAQPGRRERPPATRAQRVTEESEQVKQVLLLASTEGFNKHCCSYLENSTFKSKIKENALTFLTDVTLAAVIKLKRFCVIVLESS